MKITENQIVNMIGKRVSYQGIATEDFDTDKCLLFYPIQQTEIVYSNDIATTRRLTGKKRFCKFKYKIEVEK